MTCRSSGDGNVLLVRYVAFLRAINVTTRRIKMTDLGDLFRGCGFDDVSTYIASGNVIFDSDSSPDLARIQSVFEAEFGFASEIFLRTSIQIDELLRRVPWTSHDGVIEVSFLERPPPPESARALEATAVPPEQLSVSGAEVFFLRAGTGTPTTHRESTSMRILDMKMSRRGLATVVKIREKFLLV
ncbi:MAG: DUF1697 domain-containing protein [Acidobacteria bacterium]|nr:MAG: DUF1697 domain-containing protein [Acidobacteriota bacterium]